MLPGILWSHINGLHGSVSSQIEDGPIVNGEQSILKTHGNNEYVEMEEKI
jgi:hypothetical protein